MSRPRGIAFTWGTAVVALSLAASAAPADRTTKPSRRANGRMVTIHYRAHGGARRAAVVLVPAWYGRNRHPALPLVISPHGRGVPGRKNAELWGSLPSLGGFAVVNPDGHGRRLPLFSWGYRGQVDDLARMPRILRQRIPWLRIDPNRIYAFGGSMGGSESLLLAARHPGLLAGAAAFDSTADFRLQYRNFMRTPCNPKCRRTWHGPFGLGLQRWARQEFGGTPRTAGRVYAGRSPITYARKLAFACTPIQIWWSVADRIVPEQQRQSGRLFRKIRHINPDAPVHAFFGTWKHSRDMKAHTSLPRALALFHLLPQGTWPRPPTLRGIVAPSAHACVRRRVLPLPTPGDS